MTTESIWLKPTFGLLTILIAIFFPIIAYSLWYIKRYRGKLKDRFNIIWRRNRTIKVNVRTNAGRTIERYIVPDSRGLLRIGDGVYAFVKEAATINALYNIPEITILESQVSPAIPDVIEAEGAEAEISIPQKDGSLKKETKKVPFYVLSYANLNPQKLNGHVAQEIKMALDSHIVQDILTASDRTMKKIELMFILTIVNCGLIVLMGAILYSMIHGIEVDMEVIRYAATEANP